MRNTLRASALAGLLCLALAAACGGTRTTDYDAGVAVGDGGVKRGVKPEPDAEAAVLETDYGRVVVELYPNVAPRMVERFKTLAREGFYDGTAFHRVEPTLIQGGDPNSKNEDPADDGMGDSPYPNVPAEFSDIPFEPGVVGAARTRQPDSSNCQFFITLARAPHLDEQYIVFGRVVEGLGNARIISGAPTRPRSNNPDPKVTIRRVTLQPRANFK